MTDLGSILIVSALIFTVGVGLLSIALVLIGKAFQRRQEARERDFERVVAETPDEIFLAAIAKYEGA